MLTYPEEAAQRLRDYLATHTLSDGLGTEEAACSIVAINLALTGELTDSIPECMSLVIGRWMIPVQDAMPGELRNGQEWKALLPLAAGTGREPSAEAARGEVIMAWMWDEVLPSCQGIADAGGYGQGWGAMCTNRAAEAAGAAAEAAEAAGAAAEAARAAGAAAEAARGAGAAAEAARAAGAAAEAARGAGAAAWAAGAARGAEGAWDAAWAAEAAGAARAGGAGGAARAARAAAWAARAARAAAWARYDPVSLLRRLVNPG